VLDEQWAIHYIADVAAWGGLRSMSETPSGKWYLLDFATDPPTVVTWDDTREALEEWWESWMHDDREEQFEWLTCEAGYED